MQLSERAQLKKNSYDPETRTVQAIAATESPVEVYSFEYGGIVREILLMGGLELPTKQVPLLDTHSRHTTWSVLGSASGFHIRGDELHCEIELSSEARADGTAVKIQEGHLTDISVGYEVREADAIREGQTKFYGTRSVDGPAVVVTSWRIKELSICAIGADPKAKIRSYGGNKMPENNITTTETRNETEIRASERERVSEIAALCARYGLDDMGKRCIESGATLDHVRAKVLDFIDKTEEVAPSYRAEVGTPDAEKRTDAMVDGILLRSGSRIEKVAPGAEDFAARSLVDVARECLELSGDRKARSYDASRAVQEALSARSHSTYDFTAILSAVSGKTLRDEYQVAPGSFELWTFPSVAQDFKPIHRTQLSEAPGLVEVPEAAEYQYGTFGDSEEVYAVATHGRIFSITRQAIINDDLGAFTRIPRAFAAAAKRHVNASVYAVLTGNPDMADGTALFHGDHNNLAGTPADPAIATLSAGRSAMRLQTGLQGEILNIAPRFLIVPSTLETTSDSILNTISGYEDGEGAGRNNPFYRKLELVVEPLLDAAAGVPWFMSADPRMVDTVEIAFLHGRKEPYLETRHGWTVDGVEFKARIDYGCKAIDWRGMYKTPSE